MTPARRRWVLTSLSALGFELSLIAFDWPRFASTWVPRTPFDRERRGL